MNFGSPFCDEERSGDFLVHQTLQNKLEDLVFASCQSRESPIFGIGRQLQADGLCKLMIFCSLENNLQSIVVVVLSRQNAEELRARSICSNKCINIPASKSDFERATRRFRRLVT